MTCRPAEKRECRTTREQEQDNDYPTLPEIKITLSLESYLLRCLSPFASLCFAYVSLSVAAFYGDIFIF